MKKDNNYEDSTSKNNGDRASLLTPEESEYRFELLSAYIDGEVTPQQRRQVQEWLDTDPQFHTLYTQLLGLSQGIKNVPIPQAEISTREISDEVFRRVNGERRLKRAFVLTGSAIAAVFVGAISSIFSGDNGLTPQMANQLTPEEPLMIAIHEPLVEIPDAE